MRRLQIGEWEVFPSLNRIVRGELERHLEPRAMDLLVHLAAHPGEVLAKDQVIRAVWPDTFVTDGALSYAVGQLRHTLGDDSRQPRFIETIPRRGYRLIAQVRWYEGDGNVRSVDEDRLVSSAPHEAETGAAPYPGLASFTEQDAAWFFGRESEVAALWERIRQRRLTAVIGSSGAGKTSFLRAGVISHRPPDWGVGYATPGSSPALGLARALAGDLGSDPTALRDLLLGVEELSRSGNPAGFLGAARRWRENWDEALLVVDQFEELFTLNPPAEQAKATALLSELVREAGIRVLVSIRDDFLIRCSDYPELAELFKDLTPLPVLRHEGLRRALVEPARALGYRFEDEKLVEEMVEAVAGVRGALPLLAFAVLRLWERRDRERRQLTWTAYREIGGVEGALAQHAEMTLERIGTSRRPLVRELFRNLVTAQGTRAVMEREELLSALGVRQEAEAVLGELVDARLLTTFKLEGKGEEGASHRVEVVHESLLKEWPRLVRWQAQDEEGAVLRDQLRQAAHLWEEKGRPEELLWTGAAYREFQVWKERYPGSLTALEEAFSRAMTEFAGRRRRRRRVAVAVLVAGLSLVAVSLSLLWWRSEEARSRAEIETVRAEASKLLALGQAALAADPTEALAYATASLELTDSPAARLFVERALAEGPPLRELRHEGSQWRAPAFSPDGRMLASAGFSSDVAVFHQDGTLLTRLPGHDTNPRGGIRALWADNRTLVTGFWPPVADRVRIWSIPEGKELRTIEFGGPSNWAARSGRLYASTPRQEPSGRTILQLHSWSLPGGEEESTGRFDWSGAGASNGFLTPDARAFLYLKSNSAFLQPLSGGPATAFSRHPSELTAMGLLPGSDRYWLRDAAGRIRIWTLEGSRPVQSTDLPGLESAPAGIMPEPSGRWVWSRESDREARVWDLNELPGARPISLRRNENWYASVCDVSPVGDWLSCSVYSGRKEVFWPLPASVPSVVDGYRSLTRPLAFSPDSRWLVTSWGDDGARLWPLPGTGSREIRKFAAPAGDRKAVAFDPEGRYFVTMGNFGKVWLIPVDGRPPRTLEGYSEDLVVMGCAVSPSGRLVAASVFYGTGTKEIRIWDVEEGGVRVFPQPQQAVEGAGGSTAASGYEGAIGWLVFHGESTLYSGGRGGIRRWNLETGEQQLVAEGDIGSVRPFGPGPTLLGFVGDRTRMQVREVLFIDPSSGTVTPATGFGEWDEILRSAYGAPSHAWAAHSVGSVAAVGGPDGLIRVGRFGEGPPHILAGHVGVGEMVAISPDLKWIASTGMDNTLRLWPMPDLSKPPLYSLPHDLMLAKLKSLTNLRAVPSPQAAGGWAIEAASFPGWKELPEW